jgi:hypothetical protein
VYGLPAAGVRFYLVKAPNAPGRNIVTGPAALQKNLGVDQVKGGNLIPHGPPHPLPVRAVLGKLVTGNNRPGGKINRTPGKKYPWNCKPQIKKPCVDIVHEATISQEPGEMLQFF